jgi:hypothetical protein
MKASTNYKTYRENDAIAPSDIKLFGRDVPAFYKTKILKQPYEERKSPSLVMGDLIDLTLTQPNDVDKLFYILTDWKASEKVKDIVDKVYEKRTAFIQKSRNDAKSLGPDHPTTMVPEDDMQYLSLDDSDLDDMLQEAIKEIGYYNNWTMDKRKDAIIEKGKDYFEQLKEVRGREIVPLKIYNKAVRSIQRARESKDMGEAISIIEGITKPEGITIRTQAAIYGTWERIRIKGLLDVLQINKSLRTVQMIEIKSCKVLQMFLRSARLRRYDVQIDMYSYLLNLALVNPSSPYHGYTLLPPKILVIPIEGEQQPEWFQFTQKDYQIARFGWDKAPGQHIFGWTESLKDIQWHKDNNKWEHHRSYYDGSMINTVDLWSSDLEPVEGFQEDENLFEEDT